MKTTYREREVGFRVPDGLDVTVIGNAGPRLRREISVTFDRREAFAIGLQFIGNALLRRRWSFFVSHEEAVK